MFRSILLFLFASCAWAAAPSVVQFKQCDSASSPFTCVMTSNVVSGNMLVVLLQHGGGDDCDSAGGSVADTRSSVFTKKVVVVNTNGGQAFSCQLTAPITSSGADTITRTQPGNLPAAMFVYEITTGSGSISYVTDTVIANSVNTITGNNMTTALNDSILFCSPGTNTSTNAWTSATPSGVTTSFVVNNGYASAGVYKVVTAGTYVCACTKTSGDARSALTGMIISWDTPIKPIRHTSIIM